MSAARPPHERETARQPALLEQYKKLSRHLQAAVLHTRGQRRPATQEAVGGMATD